MGVENLDDAVLMTRALALICGFAALQWCIRLGGLLNLAQQAWLIFLNLNKQMAVCLAGRGKSFFDNAWRPA